MKTVLKKPKRITVCVLLVLAAAILIPYAVYECTTYSSEGARQYAAELSDRKATDFFWCSINEKVYYIPKDGDHAKPQEMFVFTQLSLDARQKFEAAVKMGDNVGVYVYPSPQGEKYDLSLENRVFFSANEKRISKCVYIISTNGIEKTYEKSFIDESPLIFQIENIGKAFNVTTKIINVKFYDRDGNLIEEFDTPDYDDQY